LFSLGWPNSCLFSWGGPTIRPPQENKQLLGQPKENKQLFDHLKKINNYSTTPRKQTTIRPPEGGRIVVCLLQVVK
jgi:hypothetical protein